VAKVISDYEARTMTAIVDEDQLSLAIGRNGQNVRLASQLIGWQLDLYGSREWLEHGAERALFGGGDEGEFESADFPLNELDLPPATLAALQAAGYNTFYDIIDLDREDLLRIPAIGTADAERIAQLIEEMTVEEEDAGAAAAASAAEDGPAGDGSAEGAASVDAAASAGEDGEAADEDGEGKGLTGGGAAENLPASD